MMSATLNKRSSLAIALSANETRQSIRSRVVYRSYCRKIKCVIQANVRETYRLVKGM